LLFISHGSNEWFAENTAFLFCFFSNRLLVSPILKGGWLSKPMWRVQDTTYQSVQTFSNLEHTQNHSWSIKISIFSVYF
jgi:hypothetical protein